MLLHGNGVKLSHIPAHTCAKTLRRDLYVRIILYYIILYYIILYIILYYIIYICTIHPCVYVSYTMSLIIFYTSNEYIYIQVHIYIYAYTYVYTYTYVYRCITCIIILYMLI